MTALRSPLVVPIAAAILLLAGSPAPGTAQLSGLLKKKATQAVTPQTPVAFDDVILELTDERLDKVIAGKRAGKQFANGPNGPATLRAQWQETEDRWAELSNANSRELDAWDAKRAVIMTCRDSIFEAIRDGQKQAFRQRAPTDQAMIRKMLELGVALQEAQQKGDTALARKIGAEVNALSEPPPTSADSAAVARACGDPTGPQIVRQVQGLYDRKEALRVQMRQADGEVSRLEQEASGMNDKQLAMACERIKEYPKRLKPKVAMGGFSEIELAALQRRIQDLEALCD